MVATHHFVAWYFKVKMESFVKFMNKKTGYGLNKK